MNASSDANARLQHLRSVAQRLGMQLDPSRGATWSTARDGVTLALEVELPGVGWPRIAARVGCPDGIVIMATRHALLGASLRTGDARFDAEVLVGAPDETILGALDAPSRKCLLEFVKFGGAAFGGAFRIPPDVLLALGPKTEATLLGLVAVARRFAWSPTERLAGVVAIARTDPEPEVRRVLLARFAHHAELRREAFDTDRTDATTTALACLRDPWAGLDERRVALETLLSRGAPLAVAGALKDVPNDLLADVVSRLSAMLVAGTIAAQTGLSYVAHLDYHPMLTEPQRVTLIRALGHASDPATTAWLAAMCEAPSGALVAAALGALLRLGTAAGVVPSFAPGLRERLARVAPDVVAAAGQIDSGAELLAALLPYVSSEADELQRVYLAGFAATEDTRWADHVAGFLVAAEEATRLAAIDALGKLGAAPHAETLAATAWRTTVERTHSRAAIASIQQRVGEHLRGGVTLTGDDRRGGTSVID